MEITLDSPRFACKSPLDIAGIARVHALHRDDESVTDGGDATRAGRTLAGGTTPRRDRNEFPEPWGLGLLKFLREGDMNRLYVLGRQGDTELQWDAGDPESVEQARQAFDRYLRARCLAFATPPPPGGEATRIHDFDPAASEILVTRPLVGG